MKDNTTLVAIAPATIGGDVVKTVNARELHAFLEIGKRFATWIQDRIEQYGFKEGIDFIPVSGKSSGGRPSTEYHLSLDMAKELSMVERNEKGKEARQYFIECERKARQAPSDPIQALSDPSTMRDLLLGYSEKVLALESAMKEQAPKVAFAKAVEFSHDAITVGQAAKVIGTGRTRLFAFLRRHGWVTRRNEPYQAKIDAGLMDSKVGHWEHPEQGLQENITALVTGKGLMKLQQMWEADREQAA